MIACLVPCAVLEHAAHKEHSLLCTPAPHVRACPAHALQWRWRHMPVPHAHQVCCRLDWFPKHTATCHLPSATIASAPCFTPSTISSCPAHALLMPPVAMAAAMTLAHAWPWLSRRAPARPPSALPHPLPAQKLNKPAGSLESTVIVESTLRNFSQTQLMLGQHALVTDMCLPLQLRPAGPCACLRACPTSWHATCVDILPEPASGQTLSACPFRLNKGNPYSICTCHNMCLVARRVPDPHVRALPASPPRTPPLHPLPLFPTFSSLSLFPPSPISLSLSFTFPRYA